MIGSIVRQQITLLYAGAIPPEEDRKIINGPMKISSRRVCLQTVPSLIRQYAWQGRKRVSPVN